jgi:hypothetical protein
VAGTRGLNGIAAALSYIFDPPVFRFGQRCIINQTVPGFGRDKSLHALNKDVQLKTTWIKL